MSIIVNQVSKTFGHFQALDNVSLEVKEGKLVALLGPSGSGKSTLLRTIAGLEIPNQGTITIDGRDATHLNVRQRNIGFVFQHYALFKHLTVRQNIAFGLQIRKKPRRSIKHRVEELLELIQLQGLGDRYPAQLSGGQRQRVALARALAVQPRVLLLDEPFGALDAKVRKELRGWLRRLHDEVHITSIFVTHDQEEAMAVADEIVVMNRGQIEQVGTPAEIYDRPATPFVMSFVGEVNVFPSTPGTARLFRDHFGVMPINDRINPAFAQVFVRPHEIDILPFDSGSCPKATVKRVVHLGREIVAELVLPDNIVVEAHLSREQYAGLNLQSGQTVFIKPRSAKFFNDALLPVSAA